LLISIFLLVSYRTIRLTCVHDQMGCWDLSPDKQEGTGRGVGSAGLY